MTPKLGLCVLLCFVSGALLIMVLRVPPNTPIIRGFGLTLLATVLGITMSLFMYAVSRKRGGKFADTRILLINALRRGLLIGIGMLIFLALTVSEAASLITVGLLGATLLSVDYHFSAPRRKTQENTETA